MKAVTQLPYVTSVWVQGAPTSLEPSYVDISLLADHTTGTHDRAEKSASRQHVYTKQLQSEKQQQEEHDVNTMNDLLQQLRV